MRSDVPDRKTNIISLRRVHEAYGHWTAMKGLDFAPQFCFVHLVVAAYDYNPIVRSLFW